MENIINPIDKKLLLKELTQEKFVRCTNYGENYLFSITHHDSPNLMMEIGRLRELAFRAAGGGTGKNADIDEFDTAEIPYHQLIVWDPADQEILGGYRYILTKEAPKDKNGMPLLATSQLFNYSEEFKKDYLPYLIELGRSFVQPSYQSSKSSRKGIFALDNLWDGLGALVANNADVKYFFGKVTMYPHFNVEARNILLYFLERFFPDKTKLITLINPLDTKIDYKKYDGIFIGNDYKENYKILNTKVRELGENIPPLINSYMNLSPTMKTFGTSLNPYFGDVEETAIMLTIPDIYDSKIERYVGTYLQNVAEGKTKLHIEKISKG
jgi:Acetyltransferase (GNAT) domain